MPFIKGKALVVMTIRLFLHFIDNTSIVTEDNVDGTRGDWE